MSKFFNHILQGSEATEENAYNHARGLDWQEIEVEEADYPNLNYIDTVNGVGIYYNYGADSYYFTDETEKDYIMEKNNKTESEIRAQIQKTIEESFQNEEKLKNYFGWEGEEPTEELAPEDLFGDESIQATKDIEDEYGEEETAPLGSMEDAKKFVDSVTGEEDLDENLYNDNENDVKAAKSAFKDMRGEYGAEEVAPMQSFDDDKEFIDSVREAADGYTPAVQDSEGSKISRLSIVTDLSTGKRGRVSGFKIDGDNLMLNVDFTGDNFGEKGSLNPNNVKVSETSEGLEEDTIDESGRGLGHGVKNSGDRLVKMNDDNAHSPISAAINEGFMDEEEFTPHGSYTVSNTGGYEIMLNDSGDAAKVRDAYGSDNPETSDWLEIEYITDEEGESNPVIDPNGYNIPLNMVMRMNEGMGISKTIEKGANLKPANHKGKKGKKKSKKAKKSKEKIEESISRLLENKEGLKVKDIKKFINEVAEDLYKDYQSIKDLDNLKESYNLEDDTEGDDFFESLK